MHTLSDRLFLSGKNELQRLNDIKHAHVYNLIQEIKLERQVERATWIKPKS